MRSRKNYTPNTKKIKSLMALHGITGMKLAKRFGVSFKYISFIINGERLGLRIRKGITELLQSKRERVSYKTLWPDTKSTKKKSRRKAK